MFDLVFAKTIPDLYEHFQFLEIETAYYLPDWLLSCTRSVLSYRDASRVIDCFLIDGIDYMFKVCLGLLLYYESEMLKSTHYQIKDRLKNCRDIDVDKFFFLVDEQISLDEGWLAHELKKQSWSQQKNRVLAHSLILN